MGCWIAGLLNAVAAILFFPDDVPVGPALFTADLPSFSWGYCSIGHGRPSCSADMPFLPVQPASLHPGEFPVSDPLPDTAFLVNGSYSSLGICLNRDGNQGDE